MFKLTAIMPNGLIDTILVSDTKPNQHNGTTEVYPVGDDKFEVPTKDILSLTEVDK